VINGWNAKKNNNNNNNDDGQTLLAAHAISQNLIIQKTIATTLMFLAMHQGNNELLAIALKKGADVNATDIHSHETVLFKAASADNIELVYFLLEDGKANSLIKDKNGKMPYDVASKEELKALLFNYQILHSAQAGHEINFSLLESKGLKLSEIRTKIGASCLHLAVEADRANTVVELLKHGMEVNIVDKNGCTPLHVAAKNGLKEIAKILLKAGANSRLKDKESVTPGRVALKQGFDELAEYIPEKFGKEKEKKKKINKVGCSL